MIWIHTDSEARLNWAVEGVAGRPYSTVDSLPTLESKLRPADTVILIAEDPAGQGWRPWIARVRGTVPFLAIVLCTRYRPERARWRAELAPHVTLWIDQSPANLDRWLAEHGELPYRVRLAQDIEHAALLEHPFLRLVTRSLDAEHAPRSRKALARLGGLSIPTLGRRWREEVEPLARMKIKRFEQWMLITRAHERWLQFRDWQAVSRAVQADLRTIEAAAEACLGKNLKDVESLDAFDLATALDAALSGLLGASISTKRPDASER
jgi:hypothetical protein